MSTPMNAAEQEVARKILNCEHADAAEQGGVCADCGMDLGPCEWFEGIGVERECPEPVVTKVRLETRDKDTDELVEEIVMWLCKKHGKRLAYEAAGMAVPEKLQDDYEIQEIP